MTGGVGRLATVVSLHPEAGSKVPVSCVDGIGFLLEMAALRVLVVGIVKNSTLGAAVHNVGV